MLATCICFFSPGGQLMRTVNADKTFDNCLSANCYRILYVTKPPSISQKFCDITTRQFECLSRHNEQTTRLPRQNASFSASHYLENDQWIRLQQCSRSRPIWHSVQGNDSYLARRVCHQSHFQSESYRE